MRPTKKIFGKKLAAARNALFLTQREFATRAGTTESNMGRIERFEISAIELKRVPPFAKALGISEQEFCDLFAVPDNGRVMRIAAKDSPGSKGTRLDS